MEDRALAFYILRTMQLSDWQKALPGNIAVIWELQYNSVGGSAVV